MPPSGEHMTIHINAGGVSKNVAIVFDSNGEFLTRCNGYTYEASRQITNDCSSKLINKNQFEVLCQQRTAADSF